MGHSIYSFARKEEYFNNLNSMINYETSFDYDYIYLNLRSYALSKNLNKFYNYLQSLTKKESIYMNKNENKIVKLFEQFKWDKGKKLWNLMLH